MDLQSIVNQAVTDLGTYQGAAAVVTEDQVKLTADQGVASGAASTAQASAKAAIGALTDALAALPPTTPMAADPPPDIPPGSGAV